MDREPRPLLPVVFSLYHSPFGLVIMNMMLLKLLNYLHNYIYRIVSQMCKLSLFSSIPIQILPSSTQVDKKVKAWSESEKR